MGIIHVSGFDADHPLAHSGPRSECGILYRACGVRRFHFGLDDGTIVDVSGEHLEEWVRLYLSLGKGATAHWHQEPILGEATGTTEASGLLEAAHRRGEAPPQT